MAANNGHRTTRTAADVAQLESDNEYLHGEVERLNRELAIVTADRNRLQVENAMVSGTSRENLVKATRMETIIRQVSSGLVDALATISREREVAREVRKQVQEERLQGDEPPPAFLAQHAEPANERPRRDLATEVRRAAEVVAPPRPPVTGRVRTDIHDSRLPPPDMGLQSDDERNLAQLADDMNKPRDR